VGRVGTGSPRDRDPGFGLYTYALITLKIPIVAAVYRWEGQGICVLEGGGTLIMAQTRTSAVGIMSREREGKNVVCILVEVLLKIRGKGIL